MAKLLVLPEFHHSLGGSTVSLSLMVKGFEQCDASEQICVLVMADTLFEQYLRQADQAHCMQLISAPNRREFMKKALQWIAKQPHDWPLLLDSCVSSKALSALALAVPTLRLNGRPIYHFFHDLAYSYNFVGNLARRGIFAALSPRAICNSQFTASHIRDSLMPKIEGVLYQPVNIEQFCPRLSSDIPPENLRPFLPQGLKLC